MAGEWRDDEYEAVIARLVTDLARARGMTVQQLSMHYCLPGKPPVFRR